MSEIVRIVLRADGSSEVLAGPVTIKDIERLIGARCIDCVNLRHMEGPAHVMCVDDEGYDTETVEGDGVIELRAVRARKPVNVQATALYHLNCAPGTKHQIVGDVVIVPDSDFQALK